MSESTKLHTFNVSDILGDNLVCIDGTEVITFELNTDMLDTTTISVGNVEPINLPSGYTFEQPTSLDSVVIMGSVADVANIKPESLTYVYDFSKAKIDENGNSTVVVTCEIDGYNTCWVRGYPKERTVKLTKN